MTDSTRGGAREPQTRGAPSRGAACSRRLGALLVGAASLPLLPVARGAARVRRAKRTNGDPAGCDYWRYCAIDGFLCACCGGSRDGCPPGTEPAPITWVGTCRNTGRRPRLHRLVQRLLRQELVRTLPLQPQRGRWPDLPAADRERLQLVRGQQGQHSLPLHGLAHRRGRRQGRLNARCSCFCFSSVRGQRPRGREPRTPELPDPLHGLPHGDGRGSRRKGAFVERTLARLQDRDGRYYVLRVPGVTQATLEPDRRGAELGDPRFSGAEAAQRVAVHCRRGRRGSDTFARSERTRERALAAPKRATTPQYARSDR